MLFYLLVRGGVSVIVGPLVLGELWAAVPLYLGEALCVEVAALLWYAAARLRCTAGVLIGTVGFAAEFWWTDVGLPAAVDLRHSPRGRADGRRRRRRRRSVRGAARSGSPARLPRPGSPALVFAGSVLAIVAAMVNGLWITRPDDLSATITPVGDVRRDAEKEADGDGRVRTGAPFEGDDPPG